MRVTTLRFLLCASLLLAAGCQRTLDNVTVSARSPSSLTFWIGQVATDFSPTTVSEIQEALLEFKLAIMRRGEASGAAAVERKLCTEVDNMSIRALLIRGLELKEERMQIERDLFQEHYTSLMAGRTLPGDTESEEKVQFLRDAAKTRLEKLNADLSANAARLVTLRSSAARP